jgi:hypothetical protein
LSDNTLQPKDHECQGGCLYHTDPVKRTRVFDPDTKQTDVEWLCVLAIETYEHLGRQVTALDSPSTL